MDPSASPLAQIRGAIGGPAQVRDKAVRIAGGVRMRLEPGGLQRRLERLRELGIVDAAPTRLQVRFAGLDMLRFCILPAADAYYRDLGVDIRFHYLLRFLEDPLTMLDPVGLSSTRETLVGHLLQSVHLNPVYDLQLLASFEGGLEMLERDARRAVAGEHPRQSTLETTVEDPGYHRRLLEFVVAFRADPGAPAPLRDVGDLRERPRFRLAEATFHTLPGFLRYASRLPRTLPALLRHRRAHRLDPRHCDPEAVAAILGEPGETGKTGD